MAPALEILSVPAKPGVNVKDLDSDAGKLARELCLELVDQPGCGRAHIGHEIENPGVLRLLVEWDDYQDHMNFTKQDHYGPFVKRFSSMFDGPLQMCHAHPNPWPPNQALSDTTAPVTETAMFYFKPDISEPEQQKYQKEFESVINNTVDGADGFRAYSGGWVKEEQNHPQHGPAKAFFAALGWDSVAHHTNFTKTDKWQKEGPKVLKYPGVLGVELQHAALTEVQAGADGAAGGQSTVTG